MNEKFSKRTKTFYQELCKKDNLIIAWHSVYANMKKSESNHIRVAAKRYNELENKNINQLSQQLKKMSFKFNARGIPLEKKDKNYRPVVSFDTNGRIVQRCILNILQNHIHIQPYLNCPSSYGGIKRKGISDAIEAICKSFKKENYTYVITTDIKSFFTKIKKDYVLNKLAVFCEDKNFLNLINASIDIEIDNIKTIEDNYPSLLEKYKYTEEGVPQGSCLSPLFGNIYLYELDNFMNSIPNIAYFRYIDDVVIIGANYKTVIRAFKNNLLPKLASLGLNAYTLNENNTKAYIGQIKNGFDYLGVTIYENVIKPNNKSFTNIKKEINELLADALCSETLEKKNLYEILNIISKKIKGWGNHYWFCNASREIKNLDKNIDQKISKFIKKYQAKLSKLTDASIRNELGISRFSNCTNSNGKLPIMKKIKQETTIRTDKKLLIKNTTLQKKNNSKTPF